MRLSAPPVRLWFFRPPGHTAAPIRLAMSPTGSTGATIRKYNPVVGSGIGSNTAGTTTVPSMSIPRLTCIRALRVWFCEQMADRRVERVRASADLTAEMIAD